jgi:hypothetical protein
MSDNEEYEESSEEEESEEGESEVDESDEGSSDEAEFADDEEVRETQNDVQSQRQGPRSNPRYPDLIFTEILAPSDCRVMNTSFMPRARQIPRQFYSDNYALFEKIFGVDLLNDILIATNIKMHERFPSEDPLSLTEFRIAFGMLVFASVKRGVNDNFRDLFKDVQKNGTLDDYNLLSIRRFEFFRKCLDVGEDNYILHDGEEHRHLDVRNKIWPMFIKFNKIFTQYCDLNAIKGVAVDESMRSSFGHRDPTKRYNPAKPHRYGQQNQMVLFCLLFRILTQNRKFTVQTQNFFCAFYRKNFKTRVFRSVLTVDILLARS